MVNYFFIFNKRDIRLLVVRIGHWQSSRIFQRDVLFFPFFHFVFSVLHWFRVEFERRCIVYMHARERCQGLVHAVGCSCSRLARIRSEGPRSSFFLPVSVERTRTGCAVWLVAKGSAVKNPKGAARFREPDNALIPRSVLCT